MFWFRCGSLLLLTGVGLGAFGAHALRDALAPEMRAVYQTAVLYQLVHGLGLLAIGWLAHAKPAAPVSAAGWSLLFGTILFSGSLYLLCLTGVRKLGIITPIGGLALLAGWGLAAMAAKPGP